MRALFVTVDGEGNLPPALGIARETVRRGSSVRFLGHEPPRTAIERSGFAFHSVRAGLPTTPRPSIVTVRPGVEPPAGPGIDQVGPVWPDLLTADNRHGSGANGNVLVSLSTTRFSSRGKALQRILDAVGRPSCGSGRERVPRKSVSAGAPRDAARDVLGDGPSRAGTVRLGASIRERDGAATAVDLIAGLATVRGNGEVG